MADLWSQVPHSYPLPGTPRRAAFDQIWNAARRRTVRVCVMGDSQETYCANGDAWFAWINSLAAAFYGNMPETHFFPARSSGGGAPPSFMQSTFDIQVAAAIGSGGLTSSMFPPGVYKPNPNGYGPGLYDNNGLGMAYLLTHDNINGARSYGLNNTSLFQVSNSVGVDVLAMRRNVAGGGVQLRVATNAASQVAYHQQFGSNIDQTPATLTGAGTPGPVMLNFRNIPWDRSDGAKKYIKCYLRGTAAPGTNTCITGARFVNPLNPEGVVFTSFSEGGYKASDWAATHGDCAPFLAALGFDVYMISMGINDAIGAGHSPATFKSNIQAMMAICRAANPRCRIVLRVDTHMYSTSPSMADFNQYAGVLKEIADTDTRVLVLNTRRTMASLGHNDANESTASTTNRGAWAGSTAYSVNDVVNISQSTIFPVLYRCLTAHTSGASWGAGDPGHGSSASHTNWIRFRQVGRDYTDSGHHSDEGQKTIAMIDILGLFGGITTARYNPGWPRRMGRLDHRSLGADRCN